jgi:signal transduction histidine kinase
MQVDDISQSLTISASELLTSSRTERLISLQNIQTELDGMQLDAWQALVRVLTHEIMNSITPLASLASTSSELVRSASAGVDDAHQETLADAQDAVDTLARRADGLTAFVSSYRQLLGLPKPDRSRFPIRELFTDVVRMSAPECAHQGVQIIDQVQPASLELSADRGLIEQVLINLIRNADQALANSGRKATEGEIRLTARLNSRGQTCLEVTDNGPGIAEEVAARMFVPFYTTRKDGTGVGLALSRQIMIAHGGSIGYSQAADGGARFTLVFGA